MAKRHAPKGRIKATTATADPMSVSDPMSTHVSGDTLHGRPRCTATSKQTGNRCGRTAIPGGTVCRYHGGLAPQVQFKAMDRLLKLQEPAIHALTELVNQGEFPSTRYAAARDILDRTMGRAVERVEHTGADGGPIDLRRVSELSDAALEQRIRALLDSPNRVTALEAGIEIAVNGQDTSEETGERGG